MSRLLRIVPNSREWYTDLSVGEKGLVTMAMGIIGGAIYGTHVRRGQMRVAESDYLMATMYTVPEKKKKGFEGAWSDAARLAQRQPGYEWTRTYKALDWEDSPFHYVSFRMWNEEASFKRMVAYDSAWKELMKRLDEVCESRSTPYRVIVDDSLRRIIE